MIKNIFHRFRNKHDLIRIRLIVICLFCSGVTLAQDSHLSQFNTSPIILNPATTGMFDGNYRVHLHHRSQWKSILTNPFVSEQIAFDMPNQRFGYGGYIINNKAGVGAFNSLSAVLSGAYDISIDPEKKHHFTTGVQLGLIHKSVNVSKLSFDNQYSTANGGGFNSSISSDENFQKTSYTLPESSFGIYYYNEDKTKKYNPYLGISVFHLTSPTETFFGLENSLPRRVVVSGGTKIKIDALTSIEPNILFMKQAKNTEINIGALTYYYLKETNAYFFIGPYYRHNQALIFHTGILYNEYSFSMSYDIDLTPLKSISHGRGGVELSITYKRQDRKYMPSI